MLARLVPIIIPTIVSGWGGDGHSIVTNVATRLVSDETMRYLEYHLGTDLLTASRWADSEDAMTRYPGSADYHFSHTPYRNCQPFKIDRDCGFPGREGLCVVTGLADAIKMSIDPQISREDRSDALKFVLHFMADIHQPLHTGFREDAGGTSIQISNFANTTLHMMWDYILIDQQLSVGSTGWISFADKIMSSIELKNRQFIERIANQTNVNAVISGNLTDTTRLLEYIAHVASDTTMSSTCNIAYKDEKKQFIGSGSFLSDDYMRKGGLGVQVQLSKAAVRLALLLDAMTKVYEKARQEHKEMSREIRHARLFEERQKEWTVRSTRTIYSENTFIALALDFDVTEYLYEYESGSTGATAAASKPSQTHLTKEQRKAHKQAQRKKKAELLKKQAKAEEKLRAAKLVDGVDISELVIMESDEQYYITNRDFAKSGKLPTINILILVKFHNQAATEEPILFRLDGKVFPKTVPSIYFLTRMFNAIKGNLDDVTIPSELVVDGGIAEAQMYEDTLPRFPGATDRSILALLRAGAKEALEEKHRGNEMQMMKDWAALEEDGTSDESIQYAKWRKQFPINNLGKFEREFVTIMSESSLKAFVTAKRFCTRPDQTEFHYNAYQSLLSEGKKHHHYIVFIDRRLMDGVLDEKSWGIVIRALTSRTVAERTRQLSETNPLLVKRIGEFLTAAGRTMEDSQMGEMLKYKKFESIPRPDNPRMISFVIDFAIDPRREKFTELYRRLRFLFESK